MRFRLELDHGNSTWRAKGDPVDLSIPVNPHTGLPRAWYKGPATAEPVRSDGWIGSVAEGGSVNFRDISFNPHAHGTHTETHEHIHETFSPIDALARNSALPFVIPALIVDAPPSSIGEDWVVACPESMVASLQQWRPEAVILRCTNGDLLRDWSDTNPPFLAAGVAETLVEHDVHHLLIDLPSVDREVDGGVLRAHNTFFGPEVAPRVGCTISELLSVPSTVQAGVGLLAMQVSAFVNDAAPSRPLWFPAEILERTS